MFNRRFFRQGPIMNMPQQEGFIDIDNNAGNIDIDLNQSQMQNFNTQPMIQPQRPIIEPMRERVVNRTIEHNVPQG